MRDAASPVLMVLGPPGSGKSHLSQLLAEHFPVTVFRFRDAWKQQAAEDRELALHARTTTDGLGWLGDAWAERVLSRWLDRQGSTTGPIGRLIVCEGFPGRAAQADVLLKLLHAHDAPAMPRPVQAVVLQVGPGLAASRTSTRRVCASCDTIDSASPHRPARVREDRPDRCAACGEPCTRRSDDDPAVFRARTSRFFENIGAVERTLRHHAVPVVHCTNDRTLTHCQRMWPTVRSLAACMTAPSEASSPTHDRREVRT